MAMTPAKQREAAIRFVDQWRGHGHERSEAQRFWLQLSAQVLGVEDPFSFDKYDAEKRDAKGGFADVLLPAANLLIEQKSGNVNLDELEDRQGRKVTPLRQALDYNNSFPFDERKRFICVCNFRQFRFYDLNEDPLAKGKPYADFTLEELPDNLHVFRALIQNANKPGVNVSEIRRVDVEAARHVATLNRHLARFYHHADDDNEEHRALALTTVRIVFLYYAEDSGLLKPGQFTDYVESLSPDWLGAGLRSLFVWVDKNPEEREREYPSPILKEFPYIDGGLFHGDIPVPAVDEDFKQALLDIGRNFDWSSISPVVFGSLMEETLSRDQRRQGGMHYTSPENIHKLIDPLFLDGLKAELKTLTDQYDDRSISPQKRAALVRQLKDFQNKIAGIHFLDGSAGAGNFLTETFLQLRALEDEVLVRLQKGDVMLDLGEDYLDVKVSIRQFHGIEINGFACSVARTALWIAEQQALDRTEARLGNHYDRLPLTDSGDIVCANALQIDWNTVLPSNECDYVIGNPPFVGHISKSEEQTNDLKLVFGKGYDGYLDYVTGWFRKTADYLAYNKKAMFAFVSTNSITQGQPVKPLFKPLFDEGWRIRFAHRTFKWDAQSTDNANVHVVIVGMDRNTNIKERTLFTYTNVTSEPEDAQVKNINGYLLDAPDVFVEKRSQTLGPLSPELPRVNFGSLSLDDGNLTLDTQEEYDEAMADPIAAKYVRRYVNGRELINDINRWCLWLVDVQPSDLRNSTVLKSRVEAVKTFRANRKRKATVEASLTPWLFGENHQPDATYFAIPVVFSSRREYATCDLLDKSVIAGQKLHTCIDTDGFVFSIAESSMFMTWQKAVGGRLKSDCQFSNTIVWNNLPLPKLDEDTRRSIASAGQAVLQARRNHDGQSLADLYDPLVMPADLRKAHRELDKVVDVAFGAAKPCESNDERLQILFDSYLRMTGEQS